MTLSTRIAVMDHGRIVQVGTPNEIYEFPRTRFAAEFIGTMNVFTGIVESSDGETVCARCEETDRVLVGRCASELEVGTQVSCAVRPEKIFISPEPPDASGRTVLKGVVLDLGYFGNLSLYQVKLASGKIVQVSAQNRRRSVERTLEWDDEVYLSWDDESIVVLSE